MTAPAFLQGAPATPGAHYWHTALDAGYLGGVVRRAGGWFAHLDATASRGVPAFHRAVATALDFPDYYGHNLDALADCLSDLPDRGRGVPVLLWDDWQRLADTEHRVFSTAVGLLGQWVCLVLRTTG